MNDKDKYATAKSAAETAMNTVKNKCGPHWKIIIAILAFAIIFLQTFWNMTESKISETIAKESETFKTELQAAKSDLADLGTRVSETEKGSVDLGAIKEDVASMKKTMEDFDKKLAGVIKAEEEKLAVMEKEVENQKAYVGGLKNLLEETAK